MTDRAARARIDLRRLRSEALLTQEELAFKAGVGIRTIRDIEAGRARPQTGTLRLLLRALGDTGGKAHLPAPPALVPRELPRTLATFAGRGPELEAIAAAVADGAAVVAVHGMAGVGKTSLAVRAAHDLADRFPDGQLFVDLHGFAATGPRPDLESVLTRIVRSFDTTGRARPEEFDELAAAYRSALAGKQVLLLFDNAADAAQIEPLLPGTPGSLVIATSRRDLSVLADAHPVPLGPPPMPEAVAMLGAGAAGRFTPAEAAEIAERCGRLPLAMGLAAARLRSRPLWRADDLLARLADEDLLFDELGHRGVAAALHASYRELDADHRRLLRLLGLVPGGDADARAVAALSGADERTASGLIEDLVDVHLVETRSSGRYRLHDLVRLFAAHLAAREEPEPERTAALSRLLALYLHLAYQAAARLHPNKRRFTDGAAAHDLGLPAAADQQEALAWFQAERGNLEAAVAAAADAGLNEQAWHLATAFNAFFVHDSDIGPHTAVNLIALAIAESTGDLRKEAFTLGDTGRRLLAAGRNAEAVACLERSVALKRELGEEADAALTLANLGILHRRRGRFAQSAAVHAEALARAEAVGDAAAAALIRTNMVVPLLRLGRFDDVEQCLAAAEARLDAGDEHNRVRIESFRGVLARESGDPAGAAAVHRACLDSYGGESDTADVTETLVELGEDLLRLGESGEAAVHFERAVDHAVKLVDPSLERAARNGLGRALTALGEPCEAAAQHERAAALAASHEDAYESARAHLGLADAYRAKGDEDAERMHRRLAADGLAACGLPEAEPHRR
ncbi:helix-turn-helix domain-containing protein [Glycomyces sp. NPDC047010]|uniref:ATP-binding protein n=1 Tax=Glycomyces sp. NPDC047010 TaxID=3155023 RepID=UPI003402FBD1